MSLRSEHSRRGAHRAVAAVNSPASAPPVEVHVERRSRTATFSAACRRDGAGIVWFVDGQHWNATAVCHELAHVASDSGHDALFREALVALWRRECGFLAATELSAQLGHRSIWRPTFER